MRPPGGSLSVLLAALALSAPLHGQSAIRSPGGGAPVFGEIRFAVEVAGAEVAQVELLLDGRRVAEMAQPPFELLVDVGQENVEHRFEARVRHASGELEHLLVTTPAIRIDEVLDLELQQVFVTVTDAAGKRRLGLGREAFELRDDGRRQRLVTVASGTIPFTAVLLLDGSVSMTEPQSRAARAGLLAFAEGLREDDEARLLIFGDRLLAASPFTQEPDELVAPLATAVPAGGTAISDHLYLALRLLEPRLGRRVVILLSDGGDVHSVLRMEAVRETARRSQAVIYWLEIPRPRAGDGPLLHSFLPPLELEAERRRLVRCVEASGGRVLEVSSPGEIRSALEEVLRELREQYALGYYPEPAGKGRWRSLRVRIDVPGLRVRAPEGYFAPSPEQR